MNKKGFAPLLNIMLAVAFVILGLALAGPLRNVIDDVRSPTNSEAQGLDCNNSSISDYDRGTCLATDLILPSFIGLIIGLAGVIIAARIIFS